MELRKNTKSLLLIFIFIFFAVIKIEAATYYVTPTGDNGNDGTADDDAHAWATLTYALTQISGSDTVYVKYGAASYADTAQKQIAGALSGTQANPTRIIGYYRG